MASEPAWDSPELRKVYRTLHSRVDAGSLPGILSCVLERGGAVHFDSYGHADVGREEPLRPDSIVQLYSLTKVIVSVGVGICVDEGTLALHDPVAKFIPEFGSVSVLDERGGLVALKRPMTVLHLLTHTSGLGYGPLFGAPSAGKNVMAYAHLAARARLGRLYPEAAGAIGTLEQWCQELAKIPLEFQPGAAHLYGYSHDVLGRVVEVIAKEPLEDFLRRRVFEPLGMADTGFAVPPADQHRLAALYARNRVGGPLRCVSDGGPGPWVAGRESPIRAGGGGVEDLAGGLVSTAADFARLLGMLLRRGEGPAEERAGAAAGAGDLRSPLLRASTVDLFASDLLPRVLGGARAAARASEDLLGIGFGAFGGVSAVPAAGPHSEYHAGDYGIFGAGGAAWTISPSRGIGVVTISQVADDNGSHGLLLKGIGAALQRAAQDIPPAPPSSRCKHGPPRETHAAAGQCSWGPDTDPEEVASAIWLGDSGAIRRWCSAAVDLNLVVKEGFTPLLGAARRGHLEIARCLCEARADPETKHGQDGATPLIYASIAGHLDVVRLLCSARADLGATTHRGEAALFRASGCGHRNVVQYLCVARANLEDTRASGSTAMMSAAYEGHPAVVQCLCEMRASTETACEIGTALSAAVSRGRLDVVRYLCRVGADVDVRWSYRGLSCSPLAVAARMGHGAIVRCLSEARANAGAADIDGVAPRTAAGGGHLRTVELLRWAGSAERPQR